MSKYSCKWMNCQTTPINKYSYNYKWIENAKLRRSASIHVSEWIAKLRSHFARASVFPPSGEVCLLLAGSLIIYAEINPMPVIVVGSTSHFFYRLPVLRSHGLFCTKGDKQWYMPGSRGVCWKGSNLCVLSVSREDVLLPLSRRRVADEPPFLYVEIRLPGPTCT